MICTFDVRHTMEYVQLYNGKFILSQNKRNNMCLYSIKRGKSERFYCWFASSQNVNFVSTSIESETIKNKNSLWSMIKWIILNYSHSLIHDHIAHKIQKQLKHRTQNPDKRNRISACVQSYSLWCNSWLYCYFVLLSPNSFEFSLFTAWSNWSVSL